MLRQIIHIDQSKCTGCGLCAAACHEGAIEMLDGKAWLLRENYCDGLGDCLPACPTEAITFETREAPAYNEAAVLASKQRKTRTIPQCPGSATASISPESDNPIGSVSSQLRNFPIQIKLAPVNAPFFQRADLLIAADCTAYAYGAFHSRFLKDHVCLIGCTKLDGVSYADKLAQIFRNNEIRSIAVVRMEVPCCCGMAKAVQAAISACGKDIPLTVHVLSTKGELLEG